MERKFLDEQSPPLPFSCPCRKPGLRRPPLAARQLPVEDFFSQPESSSWQLSPEGSRLSWLAPWPEGNNRLNITIAPVENPKAERRLTALTDRDIDSYGWLDKDRLFFLKDNGGDEATHLFIVDAATGQTRDLTPYEGVSASLVDELPSDPNAVLVEMDKDEPGLTSLYKVSLTDGTAEEILKNPGDIEGWGLTDQRGVMRTASSTDGLNRVLLYRDGDDEPFRPLLSYDFRTTNDPLGFTPDGKKLYLLSNEGRDKTALYELNPKDKTKKLLYENPTYDVGGADFGGPENTLQAAWWMADFYERHYFDENLKNLHHRLAALKPDRHMAVENKIDDENKMIVTAWDSQDPGTVYLYDKTKPNGLRQLARPYPNLPHDDLAPMKPISYKARDGLLIHGYLLLPPGKEPKNLPAVVIPHGGPQTRQNIDYQPDLQLLANRGMAVLVPNFRGSTGYGRAFRDAGYKQWGQKMLDDLTDGTRWLISQGIADPKRIAVFGASYGGHAALMSLIKEPELYAAGVDLVGITDLKKLIDEIPPQWQLLRNQLLVTIGDPEKDKAYFRENSPVYQADKITKPLFIAQGANDPRVPLGQSDKMVAALKKRGIPVEYMVKENEGHGFVNEENRIDFHKALIRFLTKHLGLQEK